MITQSLRYVDSGQLFVNENVAERFSECASVTWGDASFTLISRNEFIAELEEIDDCDGVEETIGRVKALPTDVYVNLEA